MTNLLLSIILQSGNLSQLLNDIICDNNNDIVYVNGRIYDKTQILLDNKYKSPMKFIDTIIHNAFNNPSKFHFKDRNNDTIYYWNPRKQLYSYSSK